MSDLTSIMKRLDEDRTKEFLTEAIREGAREGKGTAEEMVDRFNAATNGQYDYLLTPVFRRQLGRIYDYEITAKANDK